MLLHSGQAVQSTKEAGKVKAMEAKDWRNKDKESDKDSPRRTSFGSPTRKGKGDGKGKGKSQTQCRYFLSEMGCEKGKARSFLHEWGDQGKHGRCWSCGSTQHMKPECPVKDLQVPKVKKAGEKAPVDQPAAQPTSGISCTTTTTPVLPGNDLFAEAAQLLKSLRPVTKAIKLSSLGRRVGHF